MRRLPASLLANKTLYPIQNVFWISILGILVLAWFLPLATPDRTRLLVGTLVSALFVILIYQGLIPRFGIRPWIHQLGGLGAVAFVAYNTYLLHPYGVHIEILYMAAAAAIGMLRGKRIAFQVVILAGMAELLLALTRYQPGDRAFLTTAMEVFLLLLSGYLVSSLAGMVHHQIKASGETNRDLALLLEINKVMRSGNTPPEPFAPTAEKIARGIPVTLCRIAIYDPHKNSLRIAGAFPSEADEGWEPLSDQTFPLDELSQHKAVLDSNQPWIARKDEIVQFMQIARQERMYHHWLNTLCLLPLGNQDKKLGILAIGDARDWEDQDYRDNRLELLQTIASEISAAINNQQLYEATQQQANRLSVLNQVGQAIGATIEMDDLLELIYEQTSTILRSDTYYVALYEPDEQALFVRILIDDGERFQPVKVPSTQGLASWVMKNRQPLHIHHLSEEIETLPVKPVLVGKERISESWLGVPLVAGEHLIGLLAVASYETHAFSDDDRHLLTNLAAQAALAIDNARHHATVEEQARRDSLTGAYNHGHLLVRLHEEVERARQNNDAVSLIMLDIDYFKAYNDTYGHVVGDEVLCLLVEAIQSHVKKSDIVGRWGGEEFAVALPGATIEQAMGVAQRIRTTLTQMELFDNAGTPLPKPTVSQGIAAFPEHAASAEELVDITDKALYEAKHTGRDQVMIAPGVPRPK